MAPKPNRTGSHATPSAERREHLYKILVIGELGTGKTSIIKRYVHQFFSQHYRATIGVDFALKVLNWDANTVIRLQLWDIAGQERFGNMTRVYYKEAVGAFIVFDVARVATFDAVVKWKNDLDTKVQLPDGSPIPCILLANKCDQQKEGIVNSPAKMDEYCRERGFAGWFETSAKENINIEEAARSLVNKTEMKLGNSKSINNRVLLSTLIKDLKLDKHARTPISALSGGEKRLLSLAGTLLSNPQIIICDEPTTGLDSYSAALVVGILKQLAASGKIVICSVHQPSSDLFKEFNNIILMAEGKMLFHGTQEECRELFEDIDLSCPNNYNPAEFYIKAVSSNSNTPNYVQRILEKYDNRSLDCEEPRSVQPPKFNVSRRNWFVQVYWLIKRSYWSLKRGYSDHLLQLLLNIIVSAFVIFTCYVGINGTTQRGIQDLRGFLWLLSSEVCYSLSYNALYAFESDLTLFKREVGIYTGSAFFTSRLLSFIPRCIIWPVIYMMIAGFAVDLPNRAMTTLTITLSLMCGAVAAAAYGLGMGAMFTSTGIMGDVMPCADLPLSVMSGAFLRVTTLPFWLLPIKYISHFYYTMDAISNIYWRQIEHIDCAPNMNSSCVGDGLSVLRESGYSEDFILLDSLGLLCVTILWSIIGYCGLRREEKKGYVY